ncbi:MAG TPA: hypothetical protein VK934_04485 [Fimbriimonas sp.]|nr:hypothetical protein [Fimbriimonas sp.]
MRPIEYKADIELAQALRCAEYRLPKREGYKAHGYLAAAALRYGLIGSAATYHLLTSTDSCDEPYLLESIISWPRMVEESLKLELGRRLPLDEEPLSLMLLSRWSRRPLEVLMPMQRRFCPLEMCLESAVDDFVTEFTEPIQEGWTWWSRRRALRHFCQDASHSVRYALNFFERRNLDLEELPEIALLDE